mgnify:CR=1 FL=1
MESTWLGETLTKEAEAARKELQAALSARAQEAKALAAKLEERERKEQERKEEVFHGSLTTTSMKGPFSDRCGLIELRASW